MKNLAVIIFIIISGVTVKAESPLSGSSSPYHFNGGNCSFYGDWTANALASAAQIRRYLIQLKDNPNCAGIDKLVSEIAMPVYDQNSDSKEQRRYETLNGEMSSLQELLKSGNGSNVKLFNILLGRTLENNTMTYGSGNLSDRASKTFNYGLSVIDNILVQLPKYDECLANEPSLGLSVFFGGMTKMLASFAGSGEGNMSKLGNTMFKFVKFLQEKKFSRILRKLDQSEFWLNLSCLLETTTENYCSVKDAYEMLSYSTKEQKLFLKHQKGELDYNPLEGYFILTREVPIVSEWLKKVMFGVNPRTLADAQYKNKVIDNVNEFIQDQNSLMAMYSNAVLNYKSLTTKEARQNHVFELIKSLTRMVSGGQFLGGGNRRGDVNFFSWALMPAKIPFVLIGRNSIPPEVSVNSEGKYVMPYDMYMENGGNFLPEFADPSALLNTIGVELQRIIDMALIQASSYYQKLLIVDRANLVDKSVTSQTISVYEALQRIEVYLTKLIERIKYERGSRGLVILPNLIVTRERISDILSLYYELQKKVNNLLERYPSEEIDKIIVEDDSYTELLKQIIAKVYVSFNVILQRDTFLYTRIGTFVRYDYAYHTRNKTNLTDYQQDLMIISGKHLIQRLLNTAYGNNPAAVKQDLASAQFVNTRTMAAIERLFGDLFHPIISELKLVADGKGDRDSTKNKDTWKRIWSDSSKMYLQKLTGEVQWRSLLMSWGLGSVYNYFKRGDKYPFYWNDWNQVVIPYDDVYGSFEQLKSRFCIQTLAFRKNYEFFGLCENSVLRAHIIDDEDREVEDLNSSYDKLMMDYYTAKQIWESSKGTRSEKAKIKSLQLKTDDNICALRNYRRKNYAHWLLKQVSND